MLKHSKLTCLIIGLALLTLTSILAYLIYEEAVKAVSESKGVSVNSLAILVSSSLLIINFILITFCVGVVFAWKRQTHKDCVEDYS